MLALRKELEIVSLSLERSTSSSPFLFFIFYHFIPSDSFLRHILHVHPIPYHSILRCFLCNGPIINLFPRKKFSRQRSELCTYYSAPPPLFGTFLKSYVFLDYAIVVVVSVLTSGKNCSCPRIVTAGCVCIFRVR